jgi:RimJ/RimL family protein N-acetyltransferase
MESAPSKRLARALPDIPQWVETRSMLLSGQCEVLGLEEKEGWIQPGLSFVVRDTGQDSIYASVVGRPAQEAIVEAVGRGRKEGEIFAVTENRSHVAAVLRGWRDATAVLHTLGDAPRLPVVPDDSVRLLPSLETVDMESLSPDLRSELEDAVKISSIAAAFADGCPVSFCYAGSQTEGLWDVAIDTLEGYRNRGHAARCAAYMIEHMGRRGKQPVWGAEETNEASLGLAAKLGFVPMGEIFVLRPPSGAE